MAAKKLFNVLVIATMLCAAFLALALSLSLVTLTRGEPDLIAVSSEPLSDAVSPSPSFISFSIEQDRWTDWSGKDERNDFFFNVLENLRFKSGAPPHIRIGANSEDRTIFDPNVQVWSWYQKHISLTMSPSVIGRPISSVYCDGSIPRGE